MWAFNRISNLLDDIDGDKEEQGEAEGASDTKVPASARSSDPAPEPAAAVDSSAAAGPPLMGRGLGGLLNSAASAAAAASSAASAAGSAAAKVTAGGMTSTLNSLLGPDDDDNDEGADPAPSAAMATSESASGTADVLAGAESSSSAAAADPAVTELTTSSVSAFSREPSHSEFSESELVAKGWHVEAGDAQREEMLKGHTSARSEGATASASVSEPATRGAGSPADASHSQNLSGLVTAAAGVAQGPQVFDLAAGEDDQQVPLVTAVPENDLLPGSDSAGGVPRSPEPSTGRSTHSTANGSSVSTRSVGGTSEEFTRCEEAHGELLNSTMSLLGGEESSTNPTATAKVPPTPLAGVAAVPRPAGPSEAELRLQGELAERQQEILDLKRSLAAAESREAALSTQAAQAAEDASLHAASSKKAAVEAAVANAKSAAEAEADRRVAEACEKVKEAADGQHAADLARIRAEQQQELSAERERCSGRETALRERIEELEQERSNQAGGADEEAEKLQRLQTELMELKVSNVEMQQQLQERKAESASATAELQQRLEEVQAEAQRKREEQEAHLLATTQQIQRLQGRIDELEIEVQQKTDAAQEQAASEAAARQTASETAAKLAEAKEAEKVLEKQMEELRREVAAVKRRAREQAEQAKEAVLEEAQKDMQIEFDKMMKGKQNEIKKLQSEASTHEKTNREQAKEIERQKSEIDSLHSEVDLLRKDGEGASGEHRKELASITSEHTQRVKELEERRDQEERQKQELALNIRSLEERAHSELAQMESQKGQLEQQLAAAQIQLEGSQRQCAELSMSLGEATQRLAQLDDLAGSETAEELKNVAEAEVQQLRERLRSMEDKLLDAQATREMFSKETDMHRSELKVARDERRYLEDELKKAQDKSRELHSQLAQKAQGPSDSSSQELVIKQMQKDFEDRMERYRDEVQYLRQKCDEREKRCEQLLAEKSSLSAELRTTRGGPGDMWNSGAAGKDLETGSGQGKTGDGGGKGGSRSSTIRPMPLGTAAWLRAVDEPLRVIVKTLGTYPPARMLFFGYIAVLHIWVLFISPMLQMAGSGVHGGEQAGPAAGEELGPLAQAQLAASSDSANSSSAPAG